MFWPHVVCACVYELAESKYTVPHVRPKRTFAATHISDRSNFLTRFECLTALILTTGVWGSYNCHPYRFRQGPQPIRVTTH